MEGSLKLQSEITIFILDFTSIVLYCTSALTCSLFTLSCLVLLEHLLLLTFWCIYPNSPIINSNVPVWENLFCSYVLSS